MLRYSAEQNELFLGPISCKVQIHCNDLILVNLKEEIRADTQEQMTFIALNFL